MKVYVAGRTNNLDAVREVQQMVHEEGGVVTHDWTKIVEEVGGGAGDQPAGKVPWAKQREFALADRDGVHDADLIIMVCSQGLTGTLIEFGIGVASFIPTIIFGQPERHTVFFAMDHVKQVNNTLDLRLLVRHFKSTNAL